MKSFPGVFQWEGKAGDFRMRFEQGDILKIEHLDFPVLVVSNNFFHQSEQAIVCPVLTKVAPDPLHIEVCADTVQGSVLCEQMKLLDLRYRGYSRVARIEYPDLINISDALQSIFEY